MILLLEYIPDYWIGVSDCSIRVSQCFICKVWIISQEIIKCISSCFDMKYSNSVHCVFIAVFLNHVYCKFLKLSYYAAQPICQPIMLKIMLT